MSEGLTSEELTPEPVELYYTKPTLLPANANINQKEFWQGEKQIPDYLPDNPSTTI